MMSFLTAVVTSRGDKLLEAAVQQENSHQGASAVVDPTLKQWSSFTEDDNSILADPGLLIINPLTKIALMANLSRNGSDALTEYLSETQQETVQNSNSSAQQDVLILSIITKQDDSDCVYQLMIAFFDNVCVSNDVDVAVPKICPLDSVANPSPFNTFCTPSRYYWDLLFQPMLMSHLMLISMHQKSCPIPEAVEPEHAVWELVPPPDKAFVHLLKWIFKVKLEDVRRYSGKTRPRVGRSWLSSQEEEVYVSQQSDLWTPVNLNHVCRLKNASLGVKQAQRASKFKMSDDGKNSFFLGLQILKVPEDIFINQSKDALESLKNYGYGIL
ncbi:hypothetical protein Tco_1301312 [Tanacetum coccineum]